MRLADKPFAVNIPVGVDGNGNVLAFTDAYINTVLEARAADREIAKRLTGLVLAGQVAGAINEAIKVAEFVPWPRRPPTCSHASLPRLTEAEPTRPRPPAQTERLGSSHPLP